MVEQRREYSCILVGEGRIAFKSCGEVTLDEAVSKGGNISETWGLGYDGKSFSYPLSRFEPEMYFVVEGVYPYGLINCLKDDGVIRCHPHEIGPEKLEELIWGRSWRS